MNSSGQTKTNCHHQALLTFLLITKVINIRKSIMLSTFGRSCSTQLSALLRHQYRLTLIINFQFQLSWTLWTFCLANERGSWIVKFMRTRKLWIFKERWSILLPGSILKKFRPFYIILGEDFSFDPDVEYSKQNQVPQDYCHRSDVIIIFDGPVSSFEAAIDAALLPTQ